MSSQTLTSKKETLPEVQPVEYCDFGGCPARAVYVIFFDTPKDNFLTFCNHHYEEKAKVLVGHHIRITGELA